MNKMDLIRQNMNQRKERTLDALSDNLIRSRSASIPLKDIRLNPKNVAASDDGDEDIQRLADDIATVGLLHNLVVNQTGENDYMLISGERRYKALTKLGWTHAPCVVYDHLPEAMFGVMTVLANIDAREYSAAKRLMLYQELDTKLRELKKLGIYRGGIGRGIAQMMGVGEKQIVKYRRLIDELSPEELSQVTNINKTYQELKNTPPEEKTSPEVKFSENTVLERSAQTESQTPKTSPEVKFSEDTVPERSAQIESQTPKTSPEVKFSEDTVPERSAQTESQTPKTSPEVKFLTSDTPQGTPAPKNISGSDPAPVKHPKSYSITASELSVDYDGISYLCAFGTHVNGGWIAILNFGVATELSTADAAYNTDKIEEALRRSGEANPRPAAKQIAMIVTDRIGKM